MKTDDYILKEQYQVYVAGSHKVLPAGSFVKPIEDYYLPAHIKDKLEYKLLNKESYTYCYTHYGIVLIEKSKIRKV